MNPSLSLTDLAAAIELPERDLSQILNESLNQHFYDFINYYRIEKSKKLLKNAANDRETVLEIAFEAGFNSKSAFNTAFKKHTGTTPSAFRNGG